MVFKSELYINCQKHAPLRTYLASVDSFILEEYKVCIRQLHRALNFTSLTFHCLCGFKIAENGDYSVESEECYFIKKN